MPEFREIVQIVWETDDARTRADELIKLSEQLSASLDKLGGVSSGVFIQMTAGLAAATVQAEALSNALLQVVGRTEAAGGALGNVSVAAPGTGARGVTPEERSAAASIMSRIRHYGVVSETGGGETGWPPPAPPSFFPPSPPPGESPWKGYADGEERLLSERYAGFMAQPETIKLQQRITRYEEELANGATAVREVTEDFDILGEVVKRKTTEYTRTEGVTGPKITTIEELSEARSFGQRLKMQGLLAEQARVTEESLRGGFAGREGGLLSERYTGFMAQPETIKLQQRITRYEEELANGATAVREVTEDFDILGEVVKRKTTEYTSIGDVTGPKTTTIEELSEAQLFGKRLKMQGLLAEQARVAAETPVDVSMFTRGARTQALRFNQSIVAREIAQAEEAYYGVIEGRTPQAADDISRLHKTYEGLNKEIRDTTRSHSLLDSRFLRHATWIAQTIMLLETWRMITNVIRETSQAVLDFDAAEARLSFLGGDRGDLFGAQTEAARYGVRPEEAQQGALFLRQAGLPAAAQTAAGQLALVFKETDYKTIVAEVAQTMERASGAFDDQAKYLDLIAGLYETAPQSVEGYNDAIQNALTLHRSLNESVETTAALLTRLSFVLEVTPTAAASVISLMLKRISRDEVQSILRDRFEVVGATTDELIAQAAQRLIQYQMAGMQEAYADLVNVLSGGTISPQQAVRLPTALQEYLRITQQNIDVTGKWGVLFGEVGDTIAAKLDILKTSAANFISVWANTGTVKTFFDYLGERADEAAKNLRDKANIRQGREEFEELSQPGRERAVADFARLSGIPAEYTQTPLEKRLGFEPVIRFDFSKEILEGISRERGFGGEHGPAVRARRQAMDAIYLLMLDEGMGGGRGGPQTRPRPLGEGMGGGRGGPQTRPRPAGGPPYNPLEFGGLREMPSDFTGAMLQDAANRFQKMIEGFERGQQDYETKLRFLFFDPLTGEVTNVVASLEALKLATSDAARGMKQLGGFQELPEGVSQGALQMRVMQIAALQQAATRNAGVPYDPQWVTTFFWDQAQGAFVPITGPMDALQFALKELSEIMRKRNQIEGLYNVPAGADIRIPFASLSPIREALLGGALQGGGRIPPELVNVGANLGNAAQAHVEAAGQLIKSAFALSQSAIIMSRIKEREGAIGDGDETSLPKSLAEIIRSRIREREQAIGIGSAGAGAGGGGTARIVVNLPPPEIRIKAAPVKLSADLRTIITLDGARLADSLVKYLADDFVLLSNAGGGGGGVYNVM